MSFGVTPDGYNLKTLNDIEQETTDDLKSVTDPVTGDTLNVNFNNQFQVIALILGVILEGIADGLLVDQAAYNQFNILSATGDALSSLVKVIGITRNAATSSVVSLTFTGTPLATIPSTIGVEVTDINQSNIWIVEQDIVFDGAGNATDVIATCQTTGAVVALANSLQFLVFSVNDILTVDNPNDASIGSEEETDSELRRRGQLSTEVPSIGLPAGLQAALLDIDGVTFARVYNNVTLVTDSNGIPPKTISAVVVGGDDQDIFDQIISRNNTGETFGNTSTTYIDQNGNAQVIYFNRPTAVPIYVIVDITVTEQDVFPTNGASDISTNIVAYSTDGAVINVAEESGGNTAGFPPGTDILVSRLFTPINEVPGHTIDDVFIGTSPFPTLADDIPIGFNQIGTFSEVNITVNVTIPGPLTE